MNTARGFTLIEVMIVVAIVGLLSAIAVPAYRNYVVRAKITEGLSLAGSAKTAVAETVHLRGGLESITAGGSETGWTAPAATASVNSILIGDRGVITIQYTQAAESVVLNLTPSEPLASGGTIWKCTVAKANNFKFVPQECRNES